MVTVYMCHVPEVPSFLPNNQVDGDSEDSLVERIENYCKEVESSEAWGGHLEVGALTHCLKKCLSICSGPFPDVDNVNGIIGPAHYMGQQLDETTNKWSWCKQELGEKYMFVTIDNLCIALVLKCCPIGIDEGPETWFLDVMNGNLDTMASEMNKLQLYIGVVHQGIKLFSVQGLGSLLGDSMRNFYLVLVETDDSSQHMEVEKMNFIKAFEIDCFIALKLALLLPFKPLHLQCLVAFEDKLKQGGISDIIGGDLESLVLLLLSSVVSYEFFKGDQQLQFLLTSIIVLVVGEASTSLELLQNESQIDQADVKAIVARFSHRGLSELVASWLYVSLRYCFPSAITMVTTFLLSVALVMCVTACGVMETIKKAHIDGIVEKAKKKQLGAVLGLVDDALEFSGRDTKVIEANSTYECVTVARGFQKRTMCSLQVVYVSSSFKGYVVLTSAMLHKRLYKKKGAAATLWLVQWEGTSPEETTRKDAEDMMLRYPTFDVDVPTTDSGHMTRSSMRTGPHKGQVNKT